MGSKRLGTSAQSSEESPEIILRNTSQTYVCACSLDRICQIVCKHRALVPGTLPLFLDIGHAELRLYDCVSKSGVSAHCSCTYDRI